MKIEMPEWDAVVVGAGPAGSMAAFLLARRGWLVLLVEKSEWPRDKACGGCLNAAGVRMLREAGLGHVLDGSPALSRMRLHRGSSVLTVDLPCGAVVERRRFDDQLVQAAVDAGCMFLSGTHARLLPAEGAEFRSVSLENSDGVRRVTARLILACDGLGKSGRGFLPEEPWARVTVADRPRLGFSCTVAGGDSEAVPPETLAMCVGAAGYVGIVRTGAGGIHLGAALSPEACHASHGPAAVIQAILKECDMAAILRDRPALTFAGTGPLTCHRQTVGHGRVLALGDAAGYVEPFTGEGISWAIRAACSVADLLPADAADISDNVGSRWNHHFATHLRPRQMWCRSLRLLLGNPTMTNLALRTARLFPHTAQLLARKISA